MAAFFRMMQVSSHPVLPLHRWKSSQLTWALEENACPGSSFKANMQCICQGRHFHMTKPFLRIFKRLGLADPPLFLTQERSEMWSFSSTLACYFEDAQLFFQLKICCCTAVVINLFEPKIPDLGLDERQDLPSKQKIKAAQIEPPS